MVGPGKAIDTDRYFVICSNVLGGCSGTTGPGSHRPRDRPALRARASRSSPSRTWSTRRPLCSTTSASTSCSPSSAARWAACRRSRGRSATRSASRTVHRRRHDAAPRRAGDRLQRGRPPGDPRRPGLRAAATTTAARSRRTGLAIARMVGHITYLSDESMREKFGRRLQDDRDDHAFDFVTEFEVESYLAYQGQQVRRALRRQHVPLHDQGDGLLRPRAPATTRSR